jgi:hypothetical protein
MLIGRVVATLVALSLPAANVVAARDRLPAILPSLGFEARERDDTLKLPRESAEQLRRDALVRALVWLKPEEPLEAADLRHNPRDLFGGAEEVACKFHPGKIGGSTPKFECVFAGGEVLKVKYGRNPEIHTEVAATRLLRALGAGADSMYLMKRVRCFGCPQDPVVMLRCISSRFEEVRRQCEPAYGERTPTGELQVKIDYGRYVDFTLVAIERKRKGKTIKTESVTGWGWDELDLVRPGRREGVRAARDALRLLAVFLNNWDNRADNQRLLCLEDGAARRPDGRCRLPLGYMDDVGGTFGHAGAAKAERKLNLEGWRAAPIWKDAATCLVEIESPPLHGATFREAVISEGGRSYLARRLRRLSARQIRDLFEGARFADYTGASGPSRDVGQWVRAFQAKVRQITARAPCPTP